MTFTDTALEKFYLFTKLLLRQLPYEQQTLPLEVVKMIDMDKYRVQEEQNGRIVLTHEGAALEPTRDDGVRGKQEAETIPLPDNGNSGAAPHGPPQPLAQQRAKTSDHLPPAH